MFFYYQRRPIGVMPAVSTQRPSATAPDGGKREIVGVVDLSQHPDARAAYDEHGMKVLTTLFPPPDGFGGACEPTAEDVQQAVDKFRADYPETAALWADLSVSSGRMGAAGVIATQPAETPSMVISDPEFKSIRSDQLSEDRLVAFQYMNHRGETALRHVYPLHLWWGSSERHPVEQWFMHGFDWDKQAFRDFALQDCDFASISEDAL